MNNLTLIEESITCSICNDIFARPIFLPCFNSICEKHVAEQGNVKLYKCLLCANEHQIPEYGFKPNTMALKLIQSFSFNDFGKEFKAYKNELYDLINEAENCLPEFETFCIETFKEFKRSLLSSRDQIIAHLNKLVESKLKRFIDKQKLIIKPIDDLDLECESLMEIKKEIRNKFEIDYINSTEKLYKLKKELDAYIDEFSFKLTKVNNIKSEILELANEMNFEDLDKASNKESIQLNPSRQRKQLDEFKNSFLITCSQSMKSVISIWDLHNECLVTTFDDRLDGIKSIHLLSNNSLITVSNTSKLKLWDLKERRCTRFLYEHRGPVHSLLSMPNETLIVGAKSALEVWNFSHNKFKDIGAHKGDINCLVKFNDSYFISGADDTSVKVWDLNFYKQVKIFRHSGPIKDVVVARNLSF